MKISSSYRVALVVFFCLAPAITFAATDIATPIETPPIAKAQKNQLHQSSPPS